MMNESSSSSHHTKNHDGVGDEESHISRRDDNSHNSNDRNTNSSQQQHSPPRPAGVDRRRMSSSTRRRSSVSVNNRRRASSFQQHRRGSATSGNGGGGGGLNASLCIAAQQDHHVPDYNDYMKAQRELRDRNRRVSFIPEENSEMQQSANHLAALYSEDEEDEEDDQEEASRNSDQANGDDNGSNNDTAAVAKDRHVRGVGVGGPSRKFLEAMAVMGRRVSHAPDSAAWATVVTQLEDHMNELDGDGHFGRTGDVSFDECSTGSENNEARQQQKDGEEGGVENDEEHEHHHHHHHHGTTLNIPWYAPPVQRQRWGDDQILPHINWNDLFFDLFYVAAAYNLGVMLMSAMNPYDWPRGLIYFLGIFGPLYNTWETDLFYSSRYTVIDYLHRLFAVIRFMIVGFIVLHIKPMELLSDPKSVETFSLTLFIFLESIMHMALNFELYCLGQGDREAIQNHTMRKIQHQLVPTSLTYMAAVIVAGVLYFSPEDGTKDEGYYPSYKDDGYKSGSNTTYSSNETEAYDSSRFLAGDGGYATQEEPGPRWALSDLALTLTAIAYLLNIVYTTYRKLRATSGKYGDIRKNFVPNNVDYLIHRYGEWVILMIGESVLSLLIVETTESVDYYLIASLGIATVIVLQALKFESEPSHADGHALWRNLKNATCFSLLIQVLSASLIWFGVSYKIFLTTVVSESEEEKEDGYGHRRRLAPAPSISPETSTAVFCSSLTLVLISLELMLLTHKGVKQSYKRLFKGSHDTGDRTMNWPLVFITLFKLFLILFTVTMPLWNNNVTLVTVWGFLVVTAMAITRIVGWGFIHHEGAIKKFMTDIVDTTTRQLKRGVSFATDHATGSSRRRKKKSKDNLQPDTEDFDSVTSKGSASINKREDIYDEMFDAVILTDLHGFILKVNQTALDVFLYENKSELVGENISMLVGGGDAQHHDMYLQRFREKQKSESQIGKQRVLHAKRKDGSEFPCIIGIKKSANEKYLVGYVRDMTNVQDDGNKLTITNLGAMDAMERVLNDSSFDAIVVIDYDGIIQGVNETAVKEFGYDSKQDFVGSNVKILIGGGGEEHHDQHIKRFRDDPAKTSSILGKQRLLKAKKKNGEEFACIIGISVIKDTDMLVGYIRNVDGVVKSIRIDGGGDRNSASSGDGDTKGADSVENDTKSAGRTDGCPMRG